MHVLGKQTPRALSGLTTALFVLVIAGPATADPPAERKPAQGVAKKKGTPRAKPKAPAGVEGNEAIDRVKRSTALIETASRSGSGFVIRPVGIVTNHHVVE